MTAADYVASLRDGRTVWFHGRRIPDVTASLREREWGPTSSSGKAVFGC